MAEGLRITFDSREQLQQVFESTLSRGGAFAAGATGYSETDEVDATFVHPVDHDELTMRARVVWVVPDGDGAGVGIAILNFTPETRDELAAWIEEHSESTSDEPAPRQLGKYTHVHERLRNLSVAEQHKVARDGDVNERVVLERIYGKGVWEALLRNPRLTGPEVMRIARMPGLPKPLLETIVSSAAWLTSPQVRRALLANRRLSGEHMQKVLRATPKHELKLMERQSAYPPAVRAAAKKMLSD